MSGTLYRVVKELDKYYKQKLREKNDFIIEFCFPF